MLLPSYVSVAVTEALCQLFALVNIQCAIEKPHISWSHVVNVCACRSSLQPS